MTIDLDTLVGVKYQSAKPMVANFDLMKKYPTVQVQDHLPVNLIEPNFDNGPWIAGGACLQWWQGLPVESHDIDVFCKNRKQADDTILKLKNHDRIVVKFVTENAITLELLPPENANHGSWSIQIITCRYFSSLKQVVNSFDITVCQLGTAGTEWITGERTAKDIRERTLRFVPPIKPTAVKRLVKYWIYGYRPVDGTIQLIQSNPETVWEFSPIEDYLNAF